MTGKKLEICGAIYPNDSTREHCKCIIRAPQLHGQHVCNCGYKWSAIDSELDAQLKKAMHEIDEAERKAFLMQKDIFIR